MIVKTTKKMTKTPKMVTFTGCFAIIYLGGLFFLLQSAPQTGAFMEYATRGTARRTREQQGSAPDAGASSSALPLGATGGAPAAGATPGA